MKFCRFAFYFILFTFLFTSCGDKPLTSYVNPMVGTDGHGHTFPGAIVPFGQIQPSPDTRLDGWDGCYQGKPVKQGTYFVLVKARGTDGQQFNIRKDVNLLRGYSEEGRTQE